jgi:hypothetical protein
MLEPLPDACVDAPGYDGISPPAAGCAAVVAPAAGEPLSAGAADVAAALLSLDVDDVFDDDLLEQAVSAIATAIASEMVKKRMWLSCNEA